MKLTPPFGASDGNFLVESSRKRKAHILDQQYNNALIFYGVSEPVEGTQIENSAHLLPTVSNSQHSAGTFSGRNVQGSTLGMVSNQNSQLTESRNKVSQFGKHQFYDMNNNSINLQTKDGNFQRAAVERINNACGNEQFLSFLHNGSPPSPLLKSPVPEIPLLSISQHQLYDMAIRNDSNTFQSYSGAHITSMEKDHSVFNLKGGMIFEQKNHSFSGCSSQKLFSLPSNTFESLEVSQHSMVKNQEFGHYGKADGRTCFQDFNKISSAIGSRQNGQNSDAVRSRDVSNIGIGCSQTSGCSEGKEVYGSYKYSKAEVISGSSSRDTVLGFTINGMAEDQLCSVTCQMPMPENSSCEKICLEDREVNSEVKFSTNTEIKITKPNVSNMENVDHIFVKKILPDVSANSAKKLLDHGVDPCHPKLPGKGEVHPGKVPPKIISKLWDGLLQLNASTTVSAVAFFKSGEKALEVNWSKLVEVKGKVRLEAFEKYIQELPRSRNRALTVISLCWKVGSSQTGLLGMKEIEKGYSEGDKVGFAQPAPGIDLYVCPRSDTIITILAKYGFFKGMAAVEDNQDSLIGCVVWRKNRTSSNSLSKNSEKMKLPVSEQQLDSPVDSTTSGTVEISSPVTTAPELEEKDVMPLMIQPVGVSTPLVSDTRSPGLVSESMSTQIKDTQASKDPVKVDNLPVTNDIPKQTPLVPDSSLVIPMALPTAWKPGSNFLPEPTRCLLKAEIPNMNIAEPKKLDGGFEFLTPVLAGPSRMSVIPQQRSASPEDDDLPEFDFSTACGLSKSPAIKLPLPGNKFYFSYAPQPDKHSTVRGIRNSGGPRPPAVPVVSPTASISSQQRSQAPTIGGLPTDTHQGMPLPMKQGKCNSQVPVFPIAEEKSTALGSLMLRIPNNVKVENKAAATQGTESHIPHKNLWDDDDDMPEWCPPDLEHRTQPIVSETTGLSNPSHIPKPASASVPPKPLLPSNSMSVHPPLPQGFPPGFNLGLLGPRPVRDNAVMPQQTRPIAGIAELGYSPGFNLNRPLRPQPTLFDIKLSIKPVDWRARKP